MNLVEEDTQMNDDDWLVAPGIQMGWDHIKGLKETLGKNGVTSN